MTKQQFLNGTPFEYKGSTLTYRFGKYNSIERKYSEGWWYVCDLDEANETSFTFIGSMLGKVMLSAVRTT